MNREKDIAVAATRGSELEVLLLPCPFCGGSDLVYRQDEADPGHFYAFHVFCRDCHCHGRNNFPIGWCESEQGAADAWNLRGYKRHQDKWEAEDSALTVNTSTPGNDLAATRDLERRVQKLEWIVSTLMEGKGIE